MFFHSLVFRMPYINNFDSILALLLRGLDALTTEETLSVAIHRDSGLTPKNVYIVRDDLTTVSRGYGYAEMASIRDSERFIAIVLAKPPFEVDGKGIMVTYAKNTYSTVYVNYVSVIKYTQYDV